MHKIDNLVMVRYMAIVLCNCGSHCGSLKKISNDEPKDVKGRPAGALVSLEANNIEEGGKDGPKMLTVGYTQPADNFSSAGLSDESGIIIEASTQPPVSPFNAVPAYASASSRNNRVITQDHAGDKTDHTNSTAASHALPSKTESWGYIATLAKLSAGKIYSIGNNVCHSVCDSVKKFFKPIDAAGDNTNTNSASNPRDHSGNPCEFTSEELEYLTEDEDTYNPRDHSGNPCEFTSEELEYLTEDEDTYNPRDHSGNPCEFTPEELEYITEDEDP